MSFTGKTFESGVGLYYFNARWYDPVMGRFISVDPKANKDLGAPLRFNPYLYCVNNPLTRIDPDGKSDVYFSRQQKVLVVVSSEGAVVGTFPAANNVDRCSNGQFPLGRYVMNGRPSIQAAYERKEITDKSVNGPLGEVDPFNFFVSGRTGMEVHSGRQDKKGFEAFTMGCIRTTDPAMRFLDLYVQNDPLKAITVVQGQFSDDLEMKLLGYNLLRNLGSVASKPASTISSELIGGNTNVQMGISVGF